MNHKFKNVLNGTPQPIPPIWFMRQAGRYHSHYQQLRKKYSFEQLCKTPELATEVACGPILDFDYDVAILFSDILFPLELFGLDLSYNPGPVFGNYLQPGDENKTISVDKIQEELSFQSEAMALTRKALPDNKSLVGFVGGPWTILSYGLNMKNEDKIDVPSIGDHVEKLLYDHLFPILKKNIEMQLNAGAEIVYIFDTNSVQLEERYFLDHYISKIKNELFLTFEKKIAYFSKNQSFYHQEISKINDMRLAGVVYSGDIGFNDFLTTKRDFFVQGNFSPNSLLKPHDDYLHDFELFVDSLKSVNMSQISGYICSLNHGVLPKTPEENVRHFIGAIRNEFSLMD